MTKLNASGAFEYRCAYRWLPISEGKTGDVEGFFGTSLQGEAGARRDAIDQIHRKLVHVNHARRWKKLPEDVYDSARLITSIKGLTMAEKALIETDWKTRVRY